MKRSSQALYTRRNWRDQLKSPPLFDDRDGDWIGLANEHPEQAA